PRQLSSNRTVDDFWPIRPINVRYENKEHCQRQSHCLKASHYNPPRPPQWRGDTKRRATVLRGTSLLLCPRHALIVPTNRSRGQFAWVERHFRQVTDEEAVQVPRSQS